MKPATLEILLRLAGIVHFLLLIVGGLMPRVLDWRKNLALLHPFLRQLFWVYAIFITLTLVSFGVITCVNAPALASGSLLARSFCGFVAVFWLIRLGVQLFVFDPKPFLTNWALKAGYQCLTIAFICFVLIYGAGAILPLP